MAPIMPFVASCSRSNSPSASDRLAFIITHGSDRIGLEFEFEEDSAAAIDVPVAAAAEERRLDADEIYASSDNFDSFRNHGGNGEDAGATDNVAKKHMASSTPILRSSFVRPVVEIPTLMNMEATMAFWTSNSRSDDPLEFHGQQISNYAQSHDDPLLLIKMEAAMDSCPQVVVNQAQLQISKFVGGDGEAETTVVRNSVCTSLRLPAKKLKLRVCACDGGDGVPDGYICRSNCAQEEEDEGRAMAMAMACCTPRAEEFKIPSAFVCPPAPKKKRRRIMEPDSSCTNSYHQHRQRLNSSSSSASSSPSPARAAAVDPHFRQSLTHPPPPAASSAIAIATYPPPTPFFAVPDDFDSFFKSLQYLRHRRDQQNRAPAAAASTAAAIIRT